MSPSGPQQGRSRIWAQAGVVAWLGLLTAFAIMTALAPHRHSVVGNYMGASDAFWRGAAVYTPKTSSGFLYVPTFAVAFSPFYALGSPAGDVVWRLFEAAVLGAAAWRCAVRLSRTGRTSDLFGVALLIAAAGSAAALQNGQSVVLLTAATLLAFDAAYDRKPMAAAAWACLAVIAKPLGVVVWLLIGAVRWRAIPWLVLFLALLLAAPYAFQSTAYVNGVYAQFIALMANIAPETVKPEWNDFTAVPEVLGVHVPPLFGYAVRMAAALATLAAVWRLTRERDYFRAALAPAAMACAYMLLFNPRAELNTYLMMAASFGLVAAALLEQPQSRRAGAAVAGACVALGLSGAATSVFNPWLNPLLLAAAWIVLIVQVFRTPAEDAVGPGGRQEAAP